MAAAEPEVLSMWEGLLDLPTHWSTLTTLTLPGLFLLSREKPATGLTAAKAEPVPAPEALAALAVTGHPDQPAARLT